MDWKINKSVLEDIIRAAKSTYPNEFISLLGGNKREKTVTELVVVSAVFGESHAMLNTWTLPINANTVGSVHSHPGYSNRPSPEDLDTFAETGEIHLIVCEPYSISTFGAYNAKGKKIAFEIVSDSG